MSLHPDSRSETERKNKHVLLLSATQPAWSRRAALLPLMIKSALTVGQVEWKHRKAASDLTQCFPNSEAC